MRPETIAIRTQTERTGEKEHSTPLFLTSSFVYDSAEDMADAFAIEDLDVNIYTRFSNPTVDEFIKKVCLLEGAEDGIATGTGMAAVFSAFMTFLSSGDHIISASAVFGSTHTILTKYLPKWGIEYSYFNMNKPETIEALIKPNTKIFYRELIVIVLICSEGYNNRFGHTSSSMTIQCITCTFTDSRAY